MNGHLDFYRKHGISPVHYQGTQEEHFERRASLYRSLRLPPLAFRGSKVLEVAAGTGQNAQYLASLNPEHLELVEPHPVGWAATNLRVMELQDYDAPFPFDIVICENWIGLDEAHLLAKLAGFVATDGVLVLTCIHPHGIYPNVLRRKLAARLLHDGMSFEKKTAVLVDAFGPHLDTIRDMTRSHADWVQDMLLNPAVERICLTFPMLIDRLPGFDFLGSSPEFAADWRWFKSLTGKKRNFNSHAMTEYHRNAARFTHYEDTDIIHGLDEAMDLLSKPEISGSHVRNMRYFKSVFGRETIHVSFQKRSPASASANASV